MRQGRAVVSLVTLPRVVTAADSAAALARAVELRRQIVGGASFDDIARAQSADSGSATDGGLLGRYAVGSMPFVEEFNAAARTLTPGQVSEPVRTQFGYHIIKADERTGDTLALRHILIPIGQSDSSAVRTDRQADALARAVSGIERPAQFDSVARAMGLSVSRHVVTQGDVLVTGDRYVPDVSAWAFSGARVGEASDLVSDDDAYFVARLDTVRHGGQQRLEDVREEVRREVAREKKLERLVPPARQLAQQAAAATLEAAARARGALVAQTPMFTRVSGAPGIGQANRAVGAAFGLPVGAVSEPVRTNEAVVVLRVDRRIEADSAGWAVQKEQQRQQLGQALRQQEVQQFVANLRQAAEIEDRRAEVRAAGRATDQ